MPDSSPTRSVRRIATRMFAPFGSALYGEVGSAGGGSCSSCESSPWVQTFAPPAPVLSSTPRIVPIPWSANPAAKMSVAE